MFLPAKATISIAQTQGKLVGNRPPSEFYFCESAEAITVLVTAGYGVSVLPDYLVPDSPLLCKIPLQGTEPLSFGVYYKTLQGNPSLKAFIQCAKEHFSYGKTKSAVPRRWTGCGKCVFLYSIHPRGQKKAVPLPRFASVCCGGRFASKQQKPRKAQAFPGWKIEKQAGGSPSSFRCCEKRRPGQARRRIHWWEWPRNSRRRSGLCSPAGCRPGRR